MSDLRIVNGRGKSVFAGVDDDNRLIVRGVSESIEHQNSDELGQVYHAFGTANLASGAIVSMFLKNNSPNERIVVNNVRHQIVAPSGGTVLPNASNYFHASFGHEYTSGGALVTPINMKKGSGNAANATVYIDNPTLTGTDMEIYRWYDTGEGRMNTFSEGGSLILEPNETLSLEYVGDQTSGIIYTRISFLFMPEHN